jgi:hypothetical protein
MVDESIIVMRSGNEHRFGRSMGHLSPIIANSCQNDHVIADGKGLQDLIGIHQA